MCNDIRRLVAVYILSIPIERALSGKAEAVHDFTLDLINDLLSLVFYYEISKRVPGVHEQPIIKNSTLLLVNDYLTNGNINLYKFTIAMIISMIFNNVAKPALKYIKDHKGIDLSHLEDSLETVVILSIANNSIYDTLAKAISLLIFNTVFKW